MPSYATRITLAGFLLACGAPCAAAQGPSLTQRFGGVPRADISTGHAAAVLVGVAALAAIDRPARDFLQAHRSRALDRLAGVFRVMGTAPAYAGVAIGITGAGLIAHDRDVERAGGRLLLSEAVTIVADEVIKKVVGRARPDASPSPYDFDPFHNKQVSFVSGHSAMAFVLATSLADDLHHTWSSVALYTFAAGTAWSRLNDNRHWPSDVFGGAVLGIGISRIVSNRWEILDINPPRFLTENPVPAD